MNKIYNVVWSHATQSWVVVSELAKAHKKKSSHSSTQSFMDVISQTFKLSLVAALLGSSLSANAASPTTLNGGKATAGGTTAIGAGSEANVEGATAIGENTYANGVAALAIGGASAREWAAQATARYTVAVGEKSRATHEFAVAMGNNAKSENNNAISVGVNAHSKGLSSTAMGANAKAGVVSTAVYDEATKTTKVVNLTAEQSAVAIGNDSRAETAAAVAVGTKAITFGSFAVAIGTDAHAGKEGLIANAGQIAVGVATRAYGAYATAIGHATEVNADFGSAFGKRANAQGVASTALGVYAQAEGHGSVAIGGPSYDNTIDNNASVDDAGKAKKAARTTGEGAVAVGASSLAHTRAVAVGIQSNASGERSIAVGHKSEAATESVSMGFNAKTQGSGNIAIGKNAGVDASKGTGDAGVVGSNEVTNSVAIGTDATATSKNSIVIGNGAKSIRADTSYKTGANAIAIGEGADASYTDSIAMGTSAAVGMTESVAIGNAAKGNVKANGNGKASTAVGARTEAEGDNATAVGVLTYATATNASAFGVSAKAQGKNSVAIGHNAQALSGGDQYDLNGTKYSNNALSSVVIGDSALTRQNRTVTLGYKSETLFTSAVAIGDAAYADAARSISIGRSTRSTGENAVALGSGDQNGNSPTTASGAHSIAVGSNARAEQSSTIAMGKDAQATIEKGVALGSSSVTTGLQNAQAFDPANGRRNYFEEARNSGRAARSTMAGVSVGSSTQSRQINNVAGGTVDTDAVNVAQLKAVNLKVEGNTTDSAGADVRLVSNTLKVQGTNNSFITTNALNNEINISTTQARTTVDDKGVASVNISNNNPTNGLVTAADIINTINQAGWNIQTSGTNLGTGNQTGKAKVSAGTDVSFQAANNLTAKRTGTTIEYGLESNLTNINSIQGAGSKVSLTAQGVDVGGQNITNLKSGGTTVNNAANIGDVQNISKTNELHIKPNTYAVGTDGSVSLAYENGNNQPVANKTTKITGIARADDLWSLQVDKNGTKTDVNAQNKKVALKQGKNVTLEAAAGQITINADDQVEKVEKDGGDSNTDNLITVTSTNAGKANATYKLNISKSAVRSAAAWNLKDGKDTGNGHAITGGESAVFKNADNDNNILVSRNLNAITVGLSKALTGMTSIGGNGSTITFTNAGLDVGSKNITNLASGGNVVTNAANIGDVNRIVGANQWGLQIDNGSRTDVPPVNGKVALKQGNDISLVKNQEGEITINSTAKLHTKGNSAGVGLVSLSDQSLTVKGAENSFIRTSAGNQEITIETTQGSIIPDSSEYSGIPSLGVDGLVTASTVVNAIQKSGWVAIGGGNVNLNSDGTRGLGYRNLIKPGSEVIFEAGKNLTVVQPSTGPAKFTFALNSKLEDITQVGGNGTTITFNQNGIGLGGDNAPKKITGVANGTDEHDAVNFGQLKNIIAANGSTETVKKDANVANNLAAVRVSKGSEGAPNAEYSVSVKTEDVKDAARQAVTLTENSTGPIKVTATPNETTHNTNYSVTFDGAEAAKSIPLSYAENNETAKTVTLEQGLKFTNGTRTVASVENGGVVKFDLNQATADKIDNAITNNTIALGDGTHFTKAQNLTEENGIRFNVVGANNSENIVTTASQDGNNISVDLSNAMKKTINNKANNTLNNITPEGEKVITGLGTEITAGDRISLDGSTTDANGKRHYRISADKQVEAVEAAEHKANDENLVEVTVKSGKKGEANATYAVGVSKQAVQNAAAWILKDGNDTASTGKTISGGQAVVIKNADANVAVKRTDNEISVGLANTLTNINSIGGNSQTIKFENEGINVGGAQITNVKSGGDVPNNAANISDVTRISQANDTFIKKGTYAVNGDNEVVLKYANAAGDVAGEAKITGVAKASDIWSLQANGTDVTPNNKKVNLVQGDNISITSKDGTVTISSNFNAADAAKNDLRLVQNQAEGSNGKYAVSDTGEVTLTVQDGNGGNKSNVVIGGIAKNDLSNITTTGESKVKNLAAWKIQANDATEQTVAGGDTVKFKNGQNIEITNENKVFTVKTADNLTASSLETGDTRVETGGITIKNGANGNATVSLTKAGLNNGGNKITNVERGTESSDAVNKGQLDEIGNNVISLGADRNTATQTQTLRQAGGIKFNVLGSSNITTAGAGNNVTVTLANALTGITSIAGNGTTVSWTSEGLNLGDGNKQIKGIAKGTQDNDAVNVAQLNAVSTQLNNTVKLGGNTGVTKEQTLSQAGGIQFNVVGAENGKNIVTKATGTDGNVTVDLSDEMKTTINNKANTNLANITTDGKKVITALGTVLEAGDRITLDDSKSDKETGKKVYKVSAAEQVEKVVKKAGDDNILEYEAPNAGQANATYTLGVSKATVADIAKKASAWNLQVNAGNAEKVEGGDTVKFVNGTNIAVTNTGKEITIGTNPNLTATSLETGDTRVETGGITIKNGANGNATVSLTKAGLNNGGNQITNVAEGTETNHAVNVGQLNKAAAKATTTVSVNDGNTDGNLVLTTNNKFADGHTNYDVKLANKVTLGTENNKKVIIDGTVGSVLVGAGDTGSPINIDGVAHQITGLTNTTLDVAGFGKSMRAATEEQLALVRSESVSKEKHIRAGEYEVGSKTIKADAKSDEVVMNYADGTGKVIENEFAVIKGVANTDLSNITEVAKTTIQSLTNVVGDGKNISVSSEEKDGVKTYTVKGADQVESVTTSTAAQDDENIATVTMVEGADKSANARYGVGVSKAKVADIAKEVVTAKDLRLVQNQAKDSDGKYSVNDAGEVSLTVQDGEGKNATSVVINGIAKSDLKNITDDGKTVVHNIAKDAVKVIEGKNTTVTSGIDKDGKTRTYAVNVKGALDEITSITNTQGSGKLTIADAGKVLIDGDKAITLDGKQGYVTGLQNKEWTVGQTTYESGRAATEDQLKSVSDKVNVVSTNTIKLTGNEGATAEQRLDKEGGIEFAVKGGDSIKTIANGSAVTIDLSDKAKATLAHKYSVEGEGNNVHVDTDTTDKANTKFKVSVDKTKLEAGVNTTVTGDGITNAFHVNVAGDLSGITSITNNTGSGKVSFAENGVVNVEGDKSISLDGKTGVITGLTNTTLDVAGFGASNRAATEEQLKALSDKAKTTVSVNNEGKDENKNLALTETTREDGHTNYDIKLADKVTLGKDNNKVVVNGENGSIVVGGNAEKAVTINGTEGTVTNLSNRTWEIGKTEAVKGRAATEDQLKALDTVINGGLNFATQTANVVINRKLGETLEIVGGDAEAEAKAEDYTGANIRTFSENNKVVIRMAKNVNLTDKGSVNVGNTVVNNNGVEIKRPAGDKAEATVVTLTGNGLNNGGNTITNVKAGEKDTDVVNVSQLNAKATAAKTTVSVNGEDKDANKNLVLAESKATDGHTNYDVKLANKVTLGTDTTKQVILDGTAGTITAGSGNNVVIVDGSKALIRVGNGTNHVSIDGASGHITGLANREWVVGKTEAVSGRAATEDQLKSVSDKVNVVASNTIKLSGDKGSTDEQRLDQKNGINFSVVGDNKYIETKAEGNKVAVGLTKDIKDKIDNAANNNLTNITNEGKKEITKLGTIVEGSDSVSVSVSKEDKDTGQKTYKVDLKPVVTIGDSNKVTINGTTGNVGGLTNKTWNPNQITSGQAATEDQLKVVHNEVKDVTNKGLTFKAQDNSSVTKKLGDTLDVVGENGITTVVSTDNKLVVKLGNNLNIGEKAKDGKEGVDGSIGVNGKDGSAVVINGKDGSIGLNGKDGKNGVTIKGADGKVGVDGKDGTTRIVYTENNKTHEVATIEDGMKFGGDKGTTVSRKLNSQLNVKGGAKGELTEHNIAVVADGNDTLNVKLAKDVDLGDKGSVKTGKTVINENGVTIGLDKKTVVKLTEEGLNNGGRRVTNIAEGKENTDAVSVSQLRRTNQAVINNAHNIARLDNKIDNVDRNLRAGIAGALATGGLYQAAQPGKSMISAGAGTYKGQNAVAVGYSRISDNGKIGVKFSVNSNTRGDKGAAASVGYQW